MKICLAPMDWITDCAYRTICKEIFAQHGNPDDELMLWTEFMSADGYHHNPPWVIKHLLQNDYEPECIAQIFWGNADTLLECAVDIQKKYQFWGIELNMWCPSPKIMKCAAWSGMLRNKAHTLEILKDISAQLTVPFSLKTRTWLSPDDVDEQFDFLIEASKYVSMISVHGRTYKQSHAWYVNRDFIYRLKARLPNTIIIGNGGLRTYQDAIDLLWPLDGNMIAQSAIWNPRVMTPHTPTLEERFALIFRHLSMSVACEIRFRTKIKQYDHTHGLIQPTYTQLNEMIKNIDDLVTDTIYALDTSWEKPLISPVEFRKYLFNYISSLPNNKAIKKKIPACRDYHSLKGLLEEYYIALQNIHP